MFLFRVDTVPDISEIYAVERPRQAEDGRPRCSRVRASKRCGAETNVFTDAYAAVNEIDLRVDGRMMAVNLVIGQFLRTSSA